MTLDSYLKDLLGGSTLQVNIVNDNAATSNRTTDDEKGSKKGSQDNNKMRRSGSFIQTREKPKKSRWEGLNRGHSDSALGKPQRRTSCDSDEMPANKALRIVDGDDNDYDDDDDDDDMGSDDAAQNRDLDCKGHHSLVRSFSDRLDKKGQSASEKRSIRSTLKALHIIRSRKPKQSSSKKQQQQQQSKNQTTTLDKATEKLDINGGTSGRYSSIGGSTSNPTRQRFRDIFKTIAPPAKPRRQTSDDANETTKTTMRSTGNRDFKSSPKEHTKILSGKSGSKLMEIPESLRELPYEQES